MDKKQLISIILFAIFVIVILARFFSVFVVPEPAYNDSIYHLELAKSLMDGEPITSSAPPFAYHFLLAGFFFITGFPMIWPFVKIVPLLVFLAQLGLAFILFKKIFPKNFLIPLIFFTSFPSAIRFGSVNMVESFSIFAVTIFAYLFYLLAVSKPGKQALFYSIFCAVSFLLLSFTKTNVIFLVPALLLGFAFISWKKIGFTKTIPLVLLALIFGLSFIFVSGVLPAPADASSYTYTSISTPRIDLISPIFFVKSTASFFDFPHESSFSKLPILNLIPYQIALPAFLLVMLPLIAALILGAFSSLLVLKLFKKPFSLIKKKFSEKEFLQVFFFTCFLASIFSIYPGLTIIRESEIYVRYMLPALPFFAILLGAAFDKLNGNFRNIFLAALVLFAFYSFAMTSTSAIFYNSVEQSNQPLYDYISSNVEINSVISMQNARAVRYYTGKETIVLNNGNYTIDEIKQAHYSKTPYISVSCYNEDLLYSVKDLFDESKTEVVFESGCAKLLKIK